MTFRKVVIYGSFGLANLGDDALMLANVNVLRKLFDASELNIICEPNAYVARICPGVNTLSPASLRLPHGHFFVYGGGTLFYAFAQSSRGLKQRIFRGLCKPLRAMAYVRAKRCPVASRFKSSVAVGLGVGPFETGGGAAQSAIDTLGSCDFVSVRDAHSYMLCTQWGISNVHFGADLCYAEEYWGGDRRSGEQRDKNGMTVGIIARDWPHGGDGATYHESLLKAMSLLRASDCDIRLFSFGRRADAIWNGQLANRGEQITIWDPTKYSIAEFVRALAVCDVIVTARYHGAVMGALLGQPIVCIGIEPKLALAADALGCRKYLWSAPFNSSLLVSTVRDIWSDYRSAAAVVSRAVTVQRERAHTMIGAYLDHIKNKLS